MVVLVVICLCTKDGSRARITNRQHQDEPMSTGVPDLAYSQNECSVTVPVKELGEGTHSFRGYIYHDVTDVGNLVAGIIPELTVTLCE